MHEWGVFAALISLGGFLALYPLRHKKKVFWGLLPFLMIFLSLAYYFFSDGLAWQAFQTEQAKKREAARVLESMGSVDAVISRLKARVTEAPKDAKAWFLLGRVYASSGNFKEAKGAFLMAHRLEGENTSYSLHYAESVWETKHQAFDDTTRELLVNILKKQPKQPDALAMLAYDAYKNKAYRMAIYYWERLLELTDGSTEEAAKLRQAIAKARQEVLHV